MYQGNNPTALQSQKMLIDALLKLMKHKEFANITIKELCETAMVSRQTFYSLFDGKEEVIGLHLDTLFHVFTKKYICRGQEHTIKELCYFTISSLVEQKELIEIMVKSNLDHVVRCKVENYLLYLWTAKQENQNYAIAFLTGALMSVIALAVKRGEFNDATQIFELIEEIITGKYFQ